MITKPTIKQVRGKRVVRIRAKVRGTTDRPRFSVFRSNTSLYVQVIDDTKGTTLVALAEKSKNKDTAVKLGAKAAELLKAKGIAAVVFDRGGYKYHGVIKALADAVREGGIKV